MKIVKRFRLKIVIFTPVKNPSILHGRVFLMQCRSGLIWSFHQYLFDTLLSGKTTQQSFFAITETSATDISCSHVHFRKKACDQFQSVTDGLVL